MSPRPPAARKTDGRSKNGSVFARYGRVAHRGWIMSPNEAQMSLSAWPSGFARKWRWGMNGCPKRLNWPDIEDFEGCKACITAVLDRDQHALEAITRRFPDVAIGFEDFLAKLKRGESTGCYARLLCVKPLPRGKTLLMELIVKTRFSYIVGTIRDHRRCILAQKIYAKKKNPKVVVPTVEITNPLVPVP